MSHLFRCDNNVCEYEIVDAPEPHGQERRCIHCDKHGGYIKKPQNKKKRTDNNFKHRKKWKEFGFICGICQSTFEELPYAEGSWHCDHIIALENGGKDKAGNTMMLCASCHQVKNGLANKTKQYRKVR